MIASLSVSDITNQLACGDTKSDQLAHSCKVNFLASMTWAIIIKKYPIIL